MPALSSKTRVLCVLSNLYGNRVTTSRLLYALSQIPDVEAVPVFLEPEDYARYPQPRWTRLSEPFAIQYIARRKVEPFLVEHFDMLLVNGWESVAAFSGIARRVPAAALMDAVPATVDRQSRAQGKGGWKRSASTAVHSFAFNRGAHAFSHFLPMGSDCLESLVKDYGRDASRCYVTLAPQDLDFWSPGPARPSSTATKLLFVGNDFHRKGGPFLLDLFTSQLREACTLTIASNDPAVSEKTLPDGVRLLRGANREQLRDLYRESDLFVFPTRQDYMPQVIAEALSTGLPCIANDVGGIRDLVVSGLTGYLMKPADSAETWASRIIQPRNDTAERDALSRGAREFAVEYLSLERFAQSVAHMIAEMRDEVHRVTSKTR